MTREQVWEPVACHSEGFNAPIGDVCLDLWTGSRPCLRTLGGEVLRKKVGGCTVAGSDWRLHGWRLHGW